MGKAKSLCNENACGNFMRQIQRVPKFVKQRICASKWLQLDLSFYRGKRRIWRDGTTPTQQQTNRKASQRLVQRKNFFKTTSPSLEKVKLQVYLIPGSTKQMFHYLSHSLSRLSASILFKVVQCIYKQEGEYGRRATFFVYSISSWKVST